MVLAMIRDLPPESRWSAWFHDPERGPEFRERFGLDDENKTIDQDGEQQPINWYMDRRTWTTDRVLMATAINRLQDLVTYVPMWEKNKHPDFEWIGPAEWRSEEPEEQGGDKITRAMAVFGYAGHPSEHESTSPASGVDQAMAAFGFEERGSS